MLDIPGSERSDGTADGNDLTSFHARRASEGEADSLAWVVARFTPFLRAQADYRLRGPLRRFWEPEVLVGEVWALALPRLRQLGPPDESWTPVLLEFLSTTLLHKLTRALNTFARTVQSRGRAEPQSVILSDHVGRVPAEVASALTHAARDESFCRLHAALERLEPEEREILVLRGIEQRPHAEVAHLLGSTTAGVTMRYHRTLSKLRSLLAGAPLGELPAD